MILEKLDHVGLNVADLDESIKFYRDLFGFRVIYRWDSPRQALVSDDQIVLGLMEHKDYDFERFTLAHVALCCKKEHFAEFVREVQAREAEVVSGPHPQRGGESILFRDPSGNLVEICYPSVSEWSRAGTPL